MPFFIDSNLGKVARKWAPNGPVHKALGRGLARDLSQSGGDWERQMKTRFVGYTGNSSRDRLQSRSGRHRQLIGFRRFGGRSWGAYIQLRSAGPGSRAHEYGAVIRPKKTNGWLSIPLPWTLTPSGGRVRSKYRTNKSGGRWSTQFGRTWIVKPRGNPSVRYVMGRVSRTKVQALRVLVRQVTLPGPNTTGGPSRLGFLRTWEGLRKDRRRAYRKTVKSLTRGQKARPS